MTQIYDKRAVGVFSNHEEAENALNELRDNGFAMNQVSVIAKDSERLNQSQQIGETKVLEMTKSTHIDQGAKTGLEAGGAVGGLTGLLVGLGTLAIPGVGPIMLAGAAATAIVTTLAGSFIGAAVGGLIGGLIGLGIPEERAKVYHDYVVSGDYLVIVDGTVEEVFRAETILKTKGVREWEVYNPPVTSPYVNPAVSRL
jgi:hypothetical protein